MATEIDPKAVTRGVLESVSDERVVLALPNSDYRIHLVPSVSASEIGTPVGKRIRGIVEAKALRIHASKGGGRFIEPVAGEPRIVSGTVLAIDEPSRRVLLNVSTPIWMTTMDEQDFGVFKTGGMVNCYVQSGPTFTPLDTQT